MCSLVGIWTVQRWYGPRWWARRSVQNLGGTASYPFAHLQSVSTLYLGTVRRCPRSNRCLYRACRALCELQSAQTVHSCTPYHRTHKVPYHRSVDVLEAQRLDRDSGVARYLWVLWREQPKVCAQLSRYEAHWRPVAPVLTTRSEPSAGSLTTSASAVRTATASPAPSHGYIQVLVRVPSNYCQPCC